MVGGDEDERSGGVHLLVNFLIFARLQLTPNTHTGNAECPTSFDVITGPQELGYWAFPTAGIHRHELYSDTYSPANNPYLANCKNCDVDGRCCCVAELVSRLQFTAARCAGAVSQ